MPKRWANSSAVPALREPTATTCWLEWSCSEATNRSAIQPVPRTPHRSVGAVRGSGWSGVGRASGKALMRFRGRRLDAARQVRVRAPGDGQRCAEVKERVHVLLDDGEQVLRKLVCGAQDLGEVGDTRGRLHHDAVANHLRE